MGNLGKLVLFVTLVFVGATSAWSTDPQVPCFFIFGDSLVDNGNNNGILSLARANYRPYGVDFPQGASGRFTNGRTMVDILGFRSFIPPYATARGDEVLRGLNYASGAAGLRSETGSNLGQHYPFAEQINHFRNTVQYMRRTFKGNTTKLRDHLSKCIYFVGMGSNDYLNNYFMPFYYPTSYEYSPSTFATLLLQAYSQQLMQLYNLGARKVAIIGIGQVGCIPYELARNRNSNNGRNNSQCNETINKDITIFNNGLVQMVNRFNKQKSGAKFIYVNTFQTSKDIAANAASYGFKVVDRGCCGVGRNNGQITCLPYQTPCSDRTKYLFWDAFHPTEVANVIYARKAYSSKSKSDAYPMNIQQLARA
ncbi:GDSL esterase/lipase At1g33811 isoform X2 [Phoenix dactylifera]|uniref:GDSL esterase/lipase At1g33811 isoform X2 n=1 Tax=Phoenix dactylifera TaxID=42345 RepID=A0A8B9ARV7_PHODC|nr:GDSL esterase/lipase At1g33811 isoform X2 [Phoenix dactylifera]